MKPVVVIGAGLSGLACASYLYRAKRKVLVIEKENSLGGRVSTQTEDGFICDQGFQVLLNSYPEVRKLIKLEDLNLKAFNSGALIYNGKSLELLANPLKHPQHFFTNLRFSALKAQDIFLVFKLLWKSRKKKEDSCLSSVTTEQYLKNTGFSEEFIESFWRPFFLGVFLDSNLSLPSDFFLFLLRCFASGQVTVPAKGMQELPRLIAREIPKENVRLGVPVTQFTENEVVLQNGEKIEADQVVCAFERIAQESSAAFRGVTTLYFTSEKLSELSWGKWLILIPKAWGLSFSHMTLISEVAPTYSTSGKPLLSVSVIDHLNVNGEQIKKEIDQIAGRSLNLKEVYRAEVPRALPIPSNKMPGFKCEKGIIFCGDYLSSPSINGAIRSGRLAAEYILSSYKKATN